VDLASWKELIISDFLSHGLKKHGPLLIMGFDDRRTY